MINEQGFIVAKCSRKIDKFAINLERSLKPIDYMTDEEFQALPAGSVFIFDVETYINFFFVAFKSLHNGKFITFERSPAGDFDAMKLRFLMWRFCLVGFNSHAYDIPMLELAMKGLNCGELKEASDYIIKSGPNWDADKVTHFDIQKKYKIKIGKYNHVDLIEVAPLQGSLKLYSGRLHCQRMQDLPFPEDHILTEAEAEIVRPYCCNDLENTEGLFKELAPDLKLRVEMSEEYGTDLRSKSDAQIAEAVVNVELEKVLGYWPQKPTIKDAFVKYNAPDFIFFQTPALQNALEQIKAAEFYLDGLGSPIWPKGLGEREKGEKDKWILKVKVGKSYYKLGMGGLHSQEKSIAHYATDDIILSDNDVESFYPRTILNQKLFPAHLGIAFLEVYEKMVRTRIHAKTMAAKCKKEKDREGAKKWKAIADSLKIVINGLFGKFGNKWSTVYAPQLMLQVTITGQLVLLMLIEELERIGIEVVSGNTDGIICKYSNARNEDVRNTIAMWEEHTGYKTEETRYKAVYSRDVNNYIAIKEEGGDKEARFMDEKMGAKTKGTYCERGSALNSILSKNPETLICTDAVVNFLVNGTSLEKTITECKDFKRFVSVRNVKGGGEKNGKYLGKVVRWYYAKNEAGFIAYAGSGNKVAKTDAAKPAMDLPSEFPNDIDYSWYIKEAEEMLYDCGRLKKPTTGTLDFF